MGEEDLKGKIIVITGASSGFGKGAALRFAQLGSIVMLAARRDYLLDEIVASCNMTSAQAIAVPTDVSKEEEVRNLFQKTVQSFGRIDVWINNAGAAAVGEFTDIPLAEHQQVIETDLLGTMYGSYFAMQQFRKQNFGTLINVASMIGKMPVPYYSSYAAAKHGVVGLSASLRQELQELKLEKIHVCTVMPMAMDTPFFEHAANYSGRETVPIPPMNEGQKVVDVLIQLAYDPKDEVPVGTGSGASVIAHNIAPALTESLMAKTTHKAQMQEAKPAEPTAGGLRQPDPSGTGIKGNV